MKQDSFPLSELQYAMLLDSLVAPHEGGYILPSTFIELAESLSLVQEIDLQVVEKLLAVMRQLAEEGTSFSAVHDRVRTERALELLQDAEVTIASVGSQIGFNDVRDFRRAFKRWTGHTPSETRRTPA